MHIRVASSLLTSGTNAGKVLAVGGIGDSGFSLASAELFDPATGLWVLTDSLMTPRRSHTATVLANGKVLVAGGRDEVPNITLASSELYDPLTGTWNPGLNMTFARSHHTANLLPNGSVLVAGGFFNNNPLNSAEVYVSAAINVAYYGLGDSVASGYGLLGDDQSKCHRSLEAYPKLVASALMQDFSVIDRSDIACSGTTSKGIKSQVDQALGNLLGLRQADLVTGLVSITVGANDFGWSSLSELGRHLCSPDGHFNAWVRRITAGVRRSLLDQIERLVTEENVFVVVTDYHNPFNTASNVLGLFYLPFPGNIFFQKSCFRNPERIFQLYSRTEFAIHALNSTLEAIVTTFPNGRVRMASIHASFHGRESPRETCGANSPDIEDTWVQFPFGPITTGDDCFHPNATGAQRFANAVEAVARELLIPVD